MAAMVLLVIGNIVFSERSLVGHAFDSFDVHDRFAVAWFVFGVVSLAGAVAGRISWIVYGVLLIVSALGFLINANLLLGMWATV